MQVVLDQSTEIVRAGRDVLICRTHHGFVCANAGVDASNVTDADTVVMLPRDPDGSARALRGRLRELTGATRGDPHHRQLRTGVAPRAVRRGDRLRRHDAAG